MNRDKTELVLVLDRSRSMQSCVRETESGAAELIQDQKSHPGQVSVSYYRFDTFVERVYEGVDINEVGAIKVEPRGMTALYDGIGFAIDQTGQRLAKMPESERPGLVVVAIMTDGGENASQEYSQSVIRDKVKHQTEKYGWQFMFLGANQDSFLVGGNLGFTADKTSNYATSKADLAFKGTSDVMKSMRTATSRGAGQEVLAACGYSEESRQEMSEDLKNVKKEAGNFAKRSIDAIKTRFQG